MFLEILYFRMFQSQGTTKQIYYYLYLLNINFLFFVVIIFKFFNCLNDNI